MRLDRNVNPDGTGKYVVINIRRLNWRPRTRIGLILAIFLKPSAIEWGGVGSADEFFLIKLKDIHAQDALRAYAMSASSTDPQWAAEVERLAERAGPGHSLCASPT